MTYLVTGGAGFIGSHLVEALVAAGERPIVFDDLSTGYLENLRDFDGRFDFIAGDIRDEAQLARAMSGVKVVFHHAALGSVPASVDAPVFADGVNTGGTVKVLEAARHAGVKRVLFAGSSAAYGNDPTQPKSESMVPDPLSPYAVGKLAGEHYAATFARLYGLETLAFRYFNIFGPRQRPDGAYAAAIPRFIVRALRDEAIEIYGDGETTRDFCFVDNVVKANLLAANTNSPLRGQIVNIGTGSRVSLNQVVAAIGEELGVAPTVRYCPERPGDVRHSLADITRARELLGYEPTVTWRAGLSPTIAFLRGC